MTSEVLTQDQINTKYELVGQKTQNLFQCHQFGLNIPKFVALTASTVNEVLLNGTVSEKIISDVASMLACKRFAVRSSALREDGRHSSSAGQFQTVLNASKEDIAPAILKIIYQAANKIVIDNNFSIIIQEYIEADTRGVAFSRNPNGEREMIVEYVEGKTGNIEDGSHSPARLRFYWGDTPTFPDSFKNVNIAESIKLLEDKFQWPQDVEWCIKDGTLFILQSRDITTISSTQFEQIKYIEKHLPQKPFLFEKTEISEISPRPTPLTFDLLEKIYGADGPVNKTYRRFNIHYQVTNFLKIFGNEVYVDKLLEHYTIFPKINFVNFLNIFKCINNYIKINSISLTNYGQLFLKIKALLDLQPSVLNLETALHKFLQDYETIFEINLKAGISIKNVTYLLGNEKVGVVDILQNSEIFLNMHQYDLKIPEYLSGNTLDLLDNSTFHMTTFADHDHNHSLVKIWWEGLSSIKRNYLHKPIVEVLIFNRLREYGRWLTVKNVNQIKANISNPLYLFSSFSEIFSGNIDLELCKQKKNEYQKYSHYNLPITISSKLKPIGNNKLLPLSAGTTEGILIEESDLIKAEEKSSNYILYVDSLNPNLTRHFEKINGIISMKGGLLSHLAIIAREEKIPIISGVTKDTVTFGKKYKIDGTQGTVVQM